MLNRYLLAPLAAALLLAAPRLAHAQTGSVGIGTTAPDASAALDIVSTRKGVLLPRVANTGSVTSPATGLIVFQTDSPAGYYYNSGTAAAPAWQQFLAAGSPAFIQNTTAPQAGASFNIGGSGTVGGTLTAANAVVTTALTGNGADLGSVVGVGIWADGGLNLGQANYNIYLGYQAGRVNTTGSYNLFTGFLAGYSNTTGESNVFNGALSGYRNTSGFGNVFSGYQSGLDNTTGGNNVFNGTFSGSSNTTGYHNVFSGYLAGYFNTTGSNNVFSGYQSGLRNETGSQNTALGSNSGPAVGIGNLTNATALGANVSLTQSNSVILGSGADVGIRTSDPTAALDVNGSTRLRGLATAGIVTNAADGTLGTATAASLDATTASNGLTKTGSNLALGGPLIQATTIDQAGNAFSLTGGSVGIGTSTSRPATRLYVQASDNNPSPIATFQPLNLSQGVSLTYQGIAKTGSNADSDLTLDGKGTGHILLHTTGNVGIDTSAVPSFKLDVNGSLRCVGAVNTTSDARLKQDIRPIGAALAGVLALRGVRYTFRQAAFPQLNLPAGEQVGVLAQEVEQVYPELVSTDAQGYKAVNYAQLTPVLIEALKEQQQLEALKQQVAAASAAATDAKARAATAEADHASLLTLQAQMARLLAEQPRAHK